MSIEIIVSLVVWWRGLPVRLGLLLKRQVPRCEHLATFVFWRLSWRGKLREYPEFRCRLSDPLLGDRVSPWPTCRLCEHRKAVAGTARRVALIADGSKVPAA